MGRLEDAKARLDTVLHRLEALGDQSGARDAGNHTAPAPDFGDGNRAGGACGLQPPPRLSRVAQLMAELQAR